MTSENVPVAVVTGTIGAGKSTVAALMSEVLHEAGVRHALIEVDWLGEVYPAPEDADPYSNALALQMLRTIWPQYLEAGITRAIVTMTLENQQELDDLVAAMGSPPVTVVRLDATEESRARRIKTREFGYLRDMFLDKTGEIEWKMDCFDLGDIRVRNDDDRSPLETAREALENLGWINRAS